MDKVQQLGMHRIATQMNLHVFTSPCCSYPGSENGKIKSHR